MRSRGSWIRLHAFKFFLLALILCLICVPPVAQTLRAAIATVFVRPILMVCDTIIAPFSWCSARLELVRTIEPRYSDIVQRYHEVLRENIILLGSEIHARESVSRNALYTSPVLPARVLAQYTEAERHRFLIDVGSRTGIGEDLPVVFDHTIVGKIVRTTPLYALVQVISDPLVRIPVRIGRSGARGIFEGTGDWSTGRVSYVSHLETVSVGDLIITAGDGGTYPEGLGIARVRLADKESFTYRIEAEILAPLATLETCAVMIEAQLPALD